MRFERVLALSPHTDDVELGAGGTVARLVEEGAKVAIIAFSGNEQTVQEAHRAAKVLGVTMPVFGDWPLRHFSDKRQEILQYLVDFGAVSPPDLVLCPSSFDFHQDHQVVYAEALRAFRTCTILGYELPWSCRQFDAQCLIGLEHRHLDKKSMAVDAYKSQAEKPYTDILWQLAMVRGAQGGFEYAEAFEVIRWIM